MSHKKELPMEPVSRRYGLGLKGSPTPRGYVTSTLLRLKLAI